MRLKSDDNKCCATVIKFVQDNMVTTAKSYYGDIVITIAAILDKMGYGEAFIEDVLNSDSLQIRIERMPMDSVECKAAKVEDGNYMLKE